MWTAKQFIEDLELQQNQYLDECIEEIETTVAGIPFLAVARYLKTRNIQEPIVIDTPYGELIVGLWEELFIME